MCAPYAEIAVTFEMSMYNVTEVKGEVAEVCLLSSRTNEIQVTVTVQPEETGSAEGKITYVIQKPLDFHHLICVLQNPGTLH